MFKARYSFTSKERADLRLKCRAYREKHQVSQLMLSLKLHCHPIEISKLENADTKTSSRVLKAVQDLDMEDDENLYFKMKNPVKGPPLFKRW